jgi:hypothetical protein
MIPHNGQIIRVWDGDGGFAMIGRFLYDESDLQGRKDGVATYCANVYLIENSDPPSFNHKSGWCYQSDGSRYWEQATDAEIKWFLRCEEEYRVIFKAPTPLVQIRDNFKHEFCVD